MWNYADPDGQVPAKRFLLTTEKQTFRRYRVQMVDPDHGSSLKVWKELGSPALPTLAQVRQIIGQSQLPAAQVHAIADPIVIPSQGLAVVELQR